ncbi:MAG: sugar isomerase [Planctomycetaceae bacterium]|jgi:glucosamine--fructose-6-phosphate aminotransferase (isomerizing)|nr:sugar isomerase [Planctomycetaceae bacterium]
MNLTDTRYNSFALVREMLETPDIIAGYDFGTAKEIAEAVKKTGKIFLTGEGSSRIFPAKSFIAELRRAPKNAAANITAATEGSRQAMEYDLSAWAVAVASNSGQTAEAVPLLLKLKDEKHPYRFAVTANPEAKLLEYATSGIVLSCGKEKAVAATKSVVEQALVYRSILAQLTACRFPTSAKQAGEAAKQVLDAEYGADLIKQFANAGQIYFAGRNDGVAEELSLKTIEITRKRSSYFEGTYLLHGVEEMIGTNDVLVLIEPFETEWQRIKERYVDALKIPVLAVASESTIFPTIVIPKVSGYDTILQLLAGWNFLVQIGVACNINIDKPLRARKIGNEYVGR